MIICGFPGVGKSTLGRKYPDKVRDLESSNYKWIYDESVVHLPEEQRKGPVKKAPNPAWPDNYVQAICDAEREYPLVLCSLDIDVRDALRSRGIPYTCVFPALGCKEEYLARLVNRGNSKAYVDNVANRWENWIADLAATEDFTIMLNPGEYLEDRIRDILI